MQIYLKKGWVLLKMADRIKSMIYRTGRAGFDLSGPLLVTHSLTPSFNAPGSKARVVLSFVKRLCFPGGRQGRFAFYTPRASGFGSGWRGAYFFSNSTLMRGVLS